DTGRGAGDDDIEATERGYRVGYRLRCVCGIARVSCNRSAADLSSDLLDRFAPSARDDDLRPFPSEQPGCGGPDTGPTASDKGYLVLKPHLHLPFSGRSAGCRRVARSLWTSPNPRSVPPKATLETPALVFIR